MPKWYLDRVSRPSMKRRFNLACTWTAPGILATTQCCSSVGEKSCSLHLKLRNKLDNGLKCLALKSFGPISVFSLILEQAEQE